MIVSAIVWSKRTTGDPSALAPGRKRCSLRLHRRQRARAGVTPPETEGPKRLAVFVSGGGSNFKQIHKGCSDGSIRGSIVVRYLRFGVVAEVAVVTDVPTCGAVRYARDNGIDVHIFPPKQSRGIDVHNAASAESSDTPLHTAQDVVAMLQRERVQLVLLAGYLKLVPAEIVSEFHKRMLNIHPGLLPAFGGKGMYGKRVHQSVISSGTRYSGATIHFVDEEYDTGPIVAQGIVPCHPDDTAEALAARVLRLEHELYPATVAALCDGRIAWRADGIPFVWQKV